MCALHIQQYPVAYMQRNKPLCVLYSMMSALTIYGDSLATSLLHSLSGDMLKFPNGPAGKKSESWCPRMDIIYLCFTRDNRLKWDVQRIGKLELKPAFSAASQIGRSVTSMHEILLFQPLGVDGTTTHAIACVYLNFESGKSKSHFIIDSAEPYALPLTDFTLTRVLDSNCRGWGNAIKFTAQPRLRDSAVRQMACQVTRKCARPLQDELSDETGLDTV